MNDSCVIIGTVMFPYAFTLPLNSSPPLPSPFPYPWCYPYPRFSSAANITKVLTRAHVCRNLKRLGSMCILQEILGMLCL